MLLNELSKKERLPKGTYVGMRFDQDTIQKIKRVMQDNNIPNPVDPESIHTTLIYSRKHIPDLTPMGKMKEGVSARAEKAEVFETNKGAKCLVLRLNCPKMVERHQQIMSQYGATYDHDEYKPHITLSYDCGDFDPNSMKLGELDLNASEEYSQDLELDWAKNNA